MISLCCTHSDCCNLTKKMIQRAPMGSIRQPLNPSSGSTKETAFIQCIDGQDPHIHVLWCLGLDKTSREVLPAEQVEVIAGTVGEFVTNYPSENGCRIQIIGQISVKDSVQFLGVPGHGGGSGLKFIYNLQSPVEATGRGSENYYKQEWRGRMFNANSIYKCHLGCFRQHQY